MNMLKAKQLRDQSVDELEAQVLDTRMELFTLVNSKKQTKKLEKPHLIQTKRRDIARLKTVIGEKRKVQ
jgi:large subunit ribosomal protein L29